MILSIGMIVKNESKYFKMCLEALKPILSSVESELIIVDTGSTDNTVEIAKEFTDKIHFHKWDNNFAEARNITINKASGQWYFYIDADEILENAEDIINFFISAKHKNYKACAIKIKNIVYENSDFVVPEFFSSRIIKLDNKVKFTGIIHEQLPERDPIFLSESYLTHYGYLNSDEVLIEYKFLRNSELLKKAVEEKPNDYNMLYQLAVTYKMQKNYMEATKAIESAYNIIRGLKIYPMYIYNLLANEYINRSRFSEAEQVCQEAIVNKRTDTTAYIDTYFHLAVAQSSQGKYQEAIGSYNNYLHLVDIAKKDKLPVDFSMIVYTIESYNYVYLQMSSLYDKIENFEKAVECAKHVLDTNEKNKDNDQRMALKELINLWVKYGRYDEIISLYEEILDESPNDADKENLYIVFLENEMKRNFGVKRGIVSRFANLERYTDYVLLNKARLIFKNNEKLDEINIKIIESFNFKDNINIYAELIYYLIKESIDVSEILSKLSDKNINNYMEYLSETFKDLPKIISSYFEKYQDIEKVRYTLFSKSLKRVYLLIEKSEDASYADIFKRYVKEGIFYIEQVYKSEILDDENSNVLKNDEEIFFMYMRKAYISKEIDLKIYIAYLIKALNSDPYMKNGIEILRNEFNKTLESSENETIRVNSEFEEYKVIVKNNIKILVESKKIGEVKSLIDEYLEIIPDDLEMLMLKSEVQLQLM